MRNNDYSSDVKKMYYTVAETAVYTGMGERTIRDCLNDPINPLPHFRIGSAGRLIRIKKDEIDAWIENFRSTSEININEIVADLMM